MNRQYVDISHFRAPYKNWMSLTGFGAEAVVGPPAAPDASGTLVLSDAAAATVWGFIQQSVAQPAPKGGDVIQLMAPLSPESRESAMVWALKRINEGKIVLAGAETGVVTIQDPSSTKFLMALPGTPEGQKLAKAATSTGQFAVLSRPPSAGGSPPAPAVKKEPGLLAKMGGPVGVAVAALAVAAVVAVVAGGKKKRHAATPNRRHR